jgi:hypothetical protein
MLDQNQTIADIQCCNNAYRDVIQLIDELHAKIYDMVLEQGLPKTDPVVAMLRGHLTQAQMRRTQLVQRGGLLVKAERILRSQGGTTSEIQMFLDAVRGQYGVDGLSQVYENDLQGIAVDFDMYHDR